MREEQGGLKEGRACVDQTFFFDVYCGELSREREDR